MTNINPLPQNSGIHKSSENEIDLRLVFASINRQKKIIILITGASALFSIFFAITRKPVWEGQFQIVLDSSTQGSMSRLSQLASSNPMLANIAGLEGKGRSRLETEVKILESPSVLEKTYNFVKNKKAQRGIAVNNLSFLKWRKKSLEIGLERGTSVLNIAYRDTDPDLVLPVIEKISRDYQQYSGRDRQRGLTQGIAYLEKQELALQEQSDISMRNAQSYALANGLGLQDGMTAESGQSSGSSSVEASREASRNEFNALKQQLELARKAGNRTVFQAPQLEANTDIYGQLQTLEAELRQKQSLLKPSDESIRRLQRQRQNLIGYINQQTIGLLEGQLLTAQSQLSSLSRPREVVLKHRELVRTAIRDEKTLAELESLLQGLQLEQARQTDPWELISTPTLLDKPVSPQKKRIVSLGLIGGLVLGCGAALVRDRRSGLIFSQDEIATALEEPLLERLSLQQPQEWANAAALLACGPLLNAKCVALIPVGTPDIQAQQTLAESLQSALSERKLLISKDLVQTRDYSTQVLLIQPGKVSRSQLAHLRQSLSLQGSPVAGWLLLDSVERTG